MFHISRSKAVAAGVCGGLLVLAQAATAQTAFLHINNPFDWGGGGEFIVTPMGFEPTQFVSLTNDGDFQTFCFQAQVNISPGTTYDAFLTPLTPPGGPNLTEQVAFLYHKFILGELEIMHNGVQLYDYDDLTPNGRKTYAGALVYAMWELTGQNTSGQMFNPRPNVTAALKDYAMDNAQVGNFYDVQLLIPVVQDFADRGDDFDQALLVKLIPTPGGTALLALAGLAATRRRR